MNSAPAPINSEDGCFWAPVEDSLMRVLGRACWSLRHIRIRGLTEIALATSAPRDCWRQP
jgi:hypothetical protein